MGRRDKMKFTKFKLGNRIMLIPEHEATNELLCALTVISEKNLESTVELSNKQIAALQNFFENTGNIFCYEVSW